MKREEAQDTAQHRANMTGQRWYAIRIKVVHGEEPPGGNWIACDEETAATYIARPYEVAYPVKVSHAKASATRRQKGRHR